MKDGTLYASRVKKAYARHRSSVSQPSIPEPDDPLHRLVVAILAVGCSDETAQRAVDRALSNMVDWNEMRVSSARELNRATGNAIPQGVRQCQRVLDALQSIYDHENRLSLNRLKSLGRREARHFLESLDGVDEYAAASVLLWSLGGHAVPVNDRLLEALRKAELVNLDTGRAEVQAFLERNISAAEAKRFCLVMQSFGVGRARLSGKTGGRKKATRAKKTTKKKTAAKKRKRSR